MISADAYPIFHFDVAGAEEGRRPLRILSSVPDIWVEVQGVSRSARWHFILHWADRHFSFVAEPEDAMVDGAAVIKNWQILQFFRPASQGELKRSALSKDELRAAIDFAAKALGAYAGNIYAPDSFNRRANVSIAPLVFERAWGEPQ